MNERAQHDTESDELRWAAMMVRAQSGCETAYRQLLQELSEVIACYLYSRFGHHHFIEDCVQESLVAIHEARHTYDEQRKFRPWLFAIVRHKAIDALRRQRSHENVVGQQREEQAIVSQGPGANQLENQVFQRNLINALSPAHRDAITLTKIHGYSTAEAAAQLSITESALKVRIHRGIGRLKRLVQADSL